MKNGNCPSGVSAAPVSHSTCTGPAKLSRLTPCGGPLSSTGGCSPVGRKEGSERSCVMPLKMHDSCQIQTSQLPFLGLSVSVTFIADCSEGQNQLWRDA